MYLFLISIPFNDVWNVLSTKCVNSTDSYCKGRIFTSLVKSRTVARLIRLRVVNAHYDTTVESRCLTKLSRKVQSRKLIRQARRVALYCSAKSYDF